MTTYPQSFFFHRRCRKHYADMLHLNIQKPKQLNLLNYVLITIIATNVIVYICKTMRASGIICLFVNTKKCKEGAIFRDKYWISSTKRKCKERIKKKNTKHERWNGIITHICKDNGPLIYCTNSCDKDKHVKVKILQSNME